MTAKLLNLAMLLIALVWLPIFAVLLSYGGLKVGKAKIIKP